MAIISEINPETAPASIQKIIADHLERLPSVQHLFPQPAQEKRQRL